MADQVPGNGFHGEVLSADASAGVAFLLYNDGSTTAFTLGSNERLAITDYSLVTAAGGDVSITANSAAAGKVIFRGTLVAGGGANRSLNTPHICPKGVVPVATAPSGRCDAIIHGKVQRA